MSGITSSISAAGNALDVLQQALSVIQNNIDNASTPGYASQQLNLEAMPMDVAAGLVGGVMADGLDDSRDQYAEEAVQSQTQALASIPRRLRIPARYRTFSMLPAPPASRPR